MNARRDIPVTVVSDAKDDQGNDQGRGDFSGNIAPLLHELRHALRRLADSGETTTIDLRSLPLAPGELEILERTLGGGELSATLNALGPSEILETAFAGIWRIVHYNQNQEIIGYFLEVTTLPTLLQTPIEDLQNGLQGLQQLINSEYPS